MPPAAVCNSTRRDSLLDIESSPVDDYVFLRGDPHASLHILQGDSASFGKEQPYRDELQHRHYREHDKGT